MALFHTVQGEGEPLLLIHGIISDSSFFHEAAKALSCHFTVITYDRRGYGQSTQAQYADFSVEAQADDAADVLSSCTDQPAWIVGNSAGGLIGLELTLRHPELVRGLILLEPSLGYDENSVEALQAWNAELNEYLRTGRIAKALPAFVRQVGTDPEGIGASKPGDLRSIKRTFQNLSAFMHGELNEIQHYLPELEQLQQINHPHWIGVTTLGKDRLFGAASLSAAKKLNWDVIWFPGNHNAAQDHPSEFATLVCETFAAD